VEPGVNEVMVTVVCGCHTRVPNPRLSTTTYLSRVSPPLSLDGFQASDTLLAVVPVTRRSVGVVGADRFLDAAVAAGAMNASVPMNTTATNGRRAARERGPLVPIEPPSTMTNYPPLRAAVRIGSHFPELMMAVRREP
jgi:hypothetical protein